MTNNWIGINKRSLGIVRVSTKKQEGRVSHETQENEIRDYCSKNGLVLVDIIRIVESAAADKDRTKYMEAMDQAQSLGCRHVLFYMFDRETRNLTDNEKNEVLVKEDRIVLHYVRDQKIFHQNTSDADFFMRDIQAATNKQFIRNLQGKVIDSMTQKAMSGWYPSNYVPLGYVVTRPKNEQGREIRKAQATIGKDPDERNIRWVTREFELRARGISFQDIRDRCVAEGLVPERKIKGYNKSAIEKRMKNPFYAGRFMWRGLEYQGKHEVFIPAHLFEAAQDTKKRSFKEPQFRHGAGVFSGGWITCYECASTVLYDPKTKLVKKTGQITTWHYYHCSNGKRFHQSLAGYSVKEDALWRQFDTAIDAIVLPPTLADTLSRAVNIRIQKINHENTGWVKALKEKVLNIQDREDKLYEDFSSRVIDAETYQRFKQRFAIERAGCEQQLEIARTRGPLFLEQNTSTLLELCKSARSLYNQRTPQEKRLFLEKLCSNPTLEKLTLRYELAKPFDVISKIRETGEWRAHLDDLRTNLESLIPRFPGSYGA